MRSAKKHAMMLCFEYVYSLAPMKTSRVSVTPFTSRICYIYIMKIGQYWIYSGVETRPFQDA